MGNRIFECNDTKLRYKAMERRAKYKTWAAPKAQPRHSPRGGRGTRVRRGHVDAGGDGCVCVDVRDFLASLDVLDFSSLYYLEVHNTNLVQSSSFCCCPTFLNFLLVYKSAVTRAFISKNAVITKNHNSASCIKCAILRSAEQRAKGEHKSFHSETQRNARNWIV